jgi:hypothetical protein
MSSDSNYDYEADRKKWLRARKRMRMYADNNKDGSKTGLETR